MTHHHSTPEDAADLRDTRDAHEGRDVRDVHDVHDVVARVLSRTGTALASTAAQHEHADGYEDGLDDGALEREARAARVGGWPHAPAGSTIAPMWILRMR